MIEVDRVAKSFDGGRSWALREASLAVPPGAFVAIVGGSGSGKTTLLKTINRLIEPDAGEVRIDGRAVRDLDPVALRRGIGYVFQGIGLFPHLSVGENIGLTPRLLGWAAADIARRTDELLDLVNLPRGYAERRPDQLSGGQRQRVGVARALAARPTVVLMDEPFGALDPITRDGLGAAYLGLHRALGLTTVMVTHDVQEAVLLADRIVVMLAGAVAADDTPAALLSGRGGPEVEALVRVPRDQARRIADMLARAEADGAGHASRGPARHG